MKVSFDHAGEGQKQRQEEEDATIQVIIKEMEQACQVKELHQPAADMFQATFPAVGKEDQMVTQYDKDRKAPIIMQEFINLNDKGPDYIPPTSQTMMTTNHPQINNLEDQPLQELHPDVITPSHHTSHQI